MDLLRKHNLVIVLMLLAFAVMLTLGNRYVNFPVTVATVYLDENGARVDGPQPDERLFARNAVSDEVERLIRADWRPDIIEVCELQRDMEGEFQFNYVLNCDTRYETAKGRQYRLQHPFVLTRSSLNQVSYDLDR